MIAQRLFLVAIPASLIVSACASDSRYPSLERRDVERVESNASPVEPDIATPAAPAPLPTGLNDRIAELRGQASASHAVFLRRASAARSRANAAKGSAQGSTRWSDAIVAISDVESARSDTMFALAELDSMLAVGAVTAADTGAAQGLPEIAAAREEVAALVAEEDAALQALTAPMGQ